MRMEKNIKRQVLVVDDEQINRDILGMIISRNYDVIYAEDGSEALQLIKENSRTLSLVMLDLMMPKIDGYELLTILHADDALRRIPVIVLTSEKSAEVKSLELGAADFITKPYDTPEVILARVQRSIQLAEDNVIIRATETDELTGLLTKEFFFQYCRQHDEYFPDLVMDAMVLNVNRFHLINDLRGRSFGNIVLTTMAGCIKNTVKQLEGLACRCESDTFYIYIPHSNDCPNKLNMLTEMIREKLGWRSISLRLGIYQEADRSIDVEERFDRANLACSRQRSIYGSSYCLYDTEMHKRELYHERLINEMDRALREKHFKVFYQPKYNIRGEMPRLSSAEALIRWFHPELGMISPGEFIPLFETNGLIQKLDRFVWREAAEQIRKWRERFGVTIPVSVNVSRMDMYDPDLESLLLDLVKSNGLDIKDYLLEITESAYTNDSSQMIKTVEKLRADGFQVEMDDFGSGYSSLNMLAALPIDALKLDMRFVRNISEGSKDMKLVSMMIEIAGMLGVSVVAEGVETEEQYRLLKNAGCDVIQGYYFSRPVPPEDFDRLIEKEFDLSLS